MQVQNTNIKKTFVVSYLQLERYGGDIGGAQLLGTQTGKRKMSRRDRQARNVCGEGTTCPGKRHFLWENLCWGTVQDEITENVSGKWSGTSGSPCRII